MRREEKTGMYLVLFSLLVFIAVIIFASVVFTQPKLGADKNMVVTQVTLDPKTFGATEIVSTNVVSTYDEVEITQVIEEPKAEKIKESIPGYLPFHSGPFRVNLQYPKTWEVNSYLAGGAVEFYKSYSNYPSKVTLNIIYPKNRDSLEKVTAYMLEEVEDIENYNLFSSFPTTLDNQEAYKLVYSGVKYGQHLKWMMVYTVVNDKVYQMTYEAHGMNFYQDLKQATKIIESFEFA